MATAGRSVEIPLLVIVDDDASTRISTQRLIRSFGFRANVFPSAQEFLESGCAQDTACLILDLRMPSMNGLQLQRLLASRSCQIPIIFVTAHGNNQDQREAMKAGAVDFLRKPVSKETLLKAIQTALMHPDAEIVTLSALKSSGPAISTTPTEAAKLNLKPRIRRRLSSKTGSVYDAGSRTN